MGDRTMLVVGALLVAGVAVPTAGFVNHATAAVPEGDTLVDVATSSSDRLVRHDMTGIMMWATDEDSAESPQHPIYQFYTEEEVEIARSGDRSYDRPPEHAQEWTEKAWQRYASDAEFGWNTVVAPRSVETVSGRFIAGMYGAFYGIHPSTRVHTDSGVQTVVAPTGTVRFMTDYLVVIPESKTDTNPIDRRVLKRHIAWSYNKSRIANVSWYASPGKYENRRLINRIFPGYRDQQERSYSTYTTDYDLKAGERALYGTVNVTATLDKRISENRCYHENETHPEGEVIADESATCAEQIYPGPYWGDDPEDYVVIQVNETVPVGENKTLITRKQVERSGQRAQQARVTVGTVADGDTADRRSRSRVVVQDTSETGRSFAGYSLISDHRGTHVVRRWQFYTGIDGRWGSYMVVTTEGSETVETPFSPMHVHAFQSAAPPNTGQIGGSFVEAFWGESRGPPTGIPDSVSVNQLSASAESADTTLTVHEQTGPQSSLQEVRLQGFVHGQETTIGSGEWNTRTLRSVDLTLSVINVSDRTTVLEVRLTDKDGDPIELARSIDSLDRANRLAGATPTDQRGFIRIESQSGQRRVYTGSQGRATVTFDRTGRFEAEYIPRRFHVVEPAYLPAEASVTTHRFQSVDTLAITIIRLGLAVIPVAIIWWYAEKAAQIWDYRR